MSDERVSTLSFVYDMRYYFLCNEPIYSHFVFDNWLLFKKNLLDETNRNCKVSKMRWYCILNQFWFKPQLVCFKCYDIFKNLENMIIWNRNWNRNSIYFLFSLEARLIWGHLDCQPKIQFIVWVCMRPLMAGLPLSLSVSLFSLLPVLGLFMASFVVWY